MIRIILSDQNGLDRIFAYGATIENAITQLVTELREDPNYRPDLRFTAKIEKGEF